MRPTSGVLMPPRLGSGALVVTPRAYSSTFSATENPISEGSVWQHNGLDWTPIATAGGFAVGTQSGDITGTNGNQYDDSYAWLNGFSANHEVEITIAINATVTGANREAECLFRWYDTATTARGYELMIPEPNASYNVQVVKWNGPAGSFTYVRDAWAGTPPRPQNGDKFGGRIVGSTLTAWIKRAGSTIWSESADLTLDKDSNPISVWTSGGGPGIGMFYRKTSGTSAASDFCATDFTAVNV